MVLGALSRTDSRQGGFTLVEVMVALVIVAVALPAFMGLVMTQLDGAARIRDKTLTFWVAENELTRLRLRKRLLPDQFQLPDEDQGTAEQFGLEWHWSLSNEPLKIGEFREIEDFRQVRIEVAPESQPDNTMAMLTGVFRDPEN